MAYQLERQTSQDSLVSTSSLTEDQLELEYGGPVPQRRSTASSRGSRRLSGLRQMHSQSSGAGEEFLLPQWSQMNNINMNMNQYQIMLDGWHQTWVPTAVWEPNPHVMSQSQGQFTWQFWWQPQQPQWQPGQWAQPQVPQQQPNYGAAVPQQIAPQWVTTQEQAQLQQTQNFFYTHGYYPGGQRIDDPYSIAYRAPASKTETAISCAIWCGASVFLFGMIIGIIICCNTDCCCKEGYDCCLCCKTVKEGYEVDSLGNAYKKNYYDSSGGYY